jgi:hypothetical protein
VAPIIKIKIRDKVDINAKAVHVGGQRRMNKNGKGFVIKDPLYQKHN